jgi:hypothetical protein
MDTTLSFLCNGALIFAALNWAQQETKRNFFSVLAASYLSFLARPDNLVYAIAFPLLCVWLLNDVERKSKTVRFLVGLGACLAVDTALKVALFGDPLPLPFYAKTSGYYEGYLAPAKWNPITHLFAFGKMALPFMLTIIVAFSSSRRAIKLLTAFLLPVLVTFAYYFGVLQIMGHEARYYFPALPFFIIGAVLIVDDYLELRETAAGPAPNKIVRLSVAGALAVVLFTPAIQTTLERQYKEIFIPTPRAYVSSVKYATPSSQPIPKFRWWWMSIDIVSELAADLPDDTIVAMSEYGFIGARVPQIQIIDPLGLHDPFFAHHGFSAEEFFSRKPDLIWFPHEDYAKIVASIQDSPMFWKDYDYYPKAFDYGFAVRKDVANREAVYAATMKAWKKAYNKLDMKEYLARPTL